MAAAAGAKKEEGGREKEGKFFGARGSGKDYRNRTRNSRRTSGKRGKTDGEGRDRKFIFMQALGERKKKTPFVGLRK